MPTFLNHKLRSYLLAGLLVWLPLVATLLVIRFIVGIMDTTLSYLPHAYQPEQLIGFQIPGLGVLLTIVVLLTTGVLVTNFLGSRIVQFGESVVDRIPLVRNIYKAVKQVLQSLFSTGSQSFRQVLLVEYPRSGLWSVAFQTGNVATELNEKTGLDLLTVFIPTTPNPTSGFLIMVPKTDVILLDLSIDDALKLVISLGVVQP